MSPVPTLVKLRCHRGHFIGAVVPWGEDATPTVFAYVKGQDTPSGAPLAGDPRTGGCPCSRPRPLFNDEIDAITALVAAAQISGRVQTYLCHKPVAVLRVPADAADGRTHHVEWKPANDVVFVDGKSERS